MLITFQSWKESPENMMLLRVISFGTACLVISLSMSNANEDCLTKAQTCFQTCIDVCNVKCNLEPKVTVENIGNWNTVALNEVLCFQKCLGKEQECHGKCDEDHQACNAKCIDMYWDSMDNIGKLKPCLGDPRFF